MDWTNAKLTLVMENVLPDGGWSCGSTYKSIKLDTGTPPTEKSLEKAYPLALRKKEIKDELNKLDKVINRSGEESYLALPEEQQDAYVTDRISLKKSLREELLGL